MPVLSLSDVLARLTPRAVVDILIVAALLYQLLSLIRGRRAEPIIAGLCMLVLLYQVAVWARLELLRTLLATLAPYSAFALVVMFQSDIRRMLARVGRRPWLTFQSRLRNREFLDEVLLAASQLAHEKVGALIVVERDIGLRTFIESGVQVDACLSRDLLLAVFHPNGALHDGAVIVQGDRIAAAACFLPLSVAANLRGASGPIRATEAQRSFGTRHRAAVGITEEADCLALVVSEETGHISIALFGQLHVNLTLAQVEERLRQHFLRPGQPGPGVASSARPENRQRAGA